MADYKLIMKVNFEMFRNILFSLLLLFSISISCTKQKESNSSHEKNNPINPIQYVDPFIGTADHGHTYPGATVPFGMVQLSPDNGIEGWDWCSGYNYTDSIIVGFSHTHLSGTGIGDLADILVMPTTNSVDLTKEIKSREDYDYKSAYSHENESAEPGYYSVKLIDSDVFVELTATQRAGFHRYTFPESDQAGIVLDLSYAVNWDKPTETFIQIENDSLVTGYRWSEGWAKNQKVYFAARFSKAFNSYKTAQGSEIQDKITEVKGEFTKAIFNFATQKDEKVFLKVGISSASIQGALENLTKEIPHWDFEKTKREAQNTWNNELSKIQINSPNEAEKKIFYTALYHTMLAPVLHSDINGEYKGADHNKHKADGFNYYTTFSLWDTFRAENPLLTILHPDRVPDMLQSMLAHHREYGYLPVWALSANETNTMTGYHAIPVISDAYLKGFGGFDMEEAYEAMKNSAMQDIRGVNFFKEYGFIPADKENESVTKNLEYAYDDWCIAQVAQKLGKGEDYQYFMKRAQSYEILFDESTGFMRGKLADNSWKKPFDPKYSSHRVDAEYTEGNAWQHSWFVPHDVQGLINLHGGNENFILKLDSLFSIDSEITGENVSVDISGLIGQYAHGNEPSHHIAYLYNYAQAPWKTQEIVRKIMSTMYTTKPTGLCGNEDCGQMSAWYVFSALGFYPVNPAEGVYVIGSPIFENTSLKLTGDKTFEVIAENVSKENKYIQSATLNGKVLDKSYIHHQDILNGGKLVFQMGNQPNKTWASSKASLPPSMTNQ